MCINSGSGPFTLQPKNQSVEHGEIVEFECRAQDYRIHRLHVYIGNKRVFPFDQSNLNFRQNLDPREYFVDVRPCNCTTNEAVGIFWIVINSRTTQVMESFWCRVFYNLQIEDSSVAYITNITYPECNPIMQKESTLSNTFSPEYSSTLCPTPSQTLDLTQTAPSRTALKPYTGDLKNGICNLHLYYCLLMLTIHDLL